jgi:hypothetical protein
MNKKDALIALIGNQEDIVEEGQEGMVEEVEEGSGAIEEVTNKEEDIKSKYV